MDSASSPPQPRREGFQPLSYAAVIETDDNFAKASAEDMVLQSLALIKRQREELTRLRSKKSLVSVTLL